MIVVDALRVDFPTTAVRALDDVSLTIQAGERVALLGRSGAGKSTFLRALLGALTPSGGAVRIDDLDPAGSPAEVRALRRGTGMVRQGNDLVRGVSARTNILMGAAGAWTLREWTAVLRGQVPQRWAGRLAELATWHGITACLPHRVERLSGGQRQRVAVCRALLTAPTLLLADEPTSGLDPATAEAVVHALTAGHRGTTIVATHDLDIAARFERVVALRDGAVVHDGTEIDADVRAAIYEPVP